MTFIHSQQTGIAARSATARRGATAILCSAAFLLSSAALAQAPAESQTAPSDAVRAMREALPGLGSCVPMSAISAAAQNSTTSLDQLMRVSAQVHPSISGRQADQTAARETAESARWGYWPSPSLLTERVGAGSNDPNYPGDKSITVLGLRQTLWAGGRLDATAARARALTEVSDYALGEQREAIAVRTAIAFGDWWRYQHQIMATDKSIAAHRALLEQVDRRIANGAAPDVDRKLTLSRERQLVNDRARLVSLRDGALRSLQQLVNLPLSEAELDRAPVNALCLASPEELAYQLIERNPRLARLRANLTALEAAVDIRRASRWPEIYARLERQWGNYAQADAPPSNRAFIGVTYQPGAGLSLESDIRSLVAQRVASGHDMASARLDLLEEFNNDWLSYNSIRERHAAILDALEDTHAIAGSYERQYQAGRKSWLDVMNLVREQLQLELQQVDLEANLISLSRKLAVVAAGLSNWGR